MYVSECILYNALCNVTDGLCEFMTFKQVGSILEAVVATVKPFGLFVRLKGFRANGLVHLSQVRMC